MASVQDIKIANRALQLCGQDGSAGKITTFADDSKAAAEISACYDDRRQFELRRNIWRFAIRHTPLRPVDTNTFLLQFPAWVASTFTPGSVVDNDGALWATLQGVSDSAIEPGTNESAWDKYFGAMTCDAWDDGTTYYAGEHVIDSLFFVWRSLVSSNSQDPNTVGATWDVGVTYALGDFTTFSGVRYRALGATTGDEPDISPGQWVEDALAEDAQWENQSGVNFTPYFVTYPAGVGPASDTATQNLFVLPANFLRLPSQNPKAGSVSVLGAPSNLQYNDWLLEAAFLVTMDTGPIVLRFAADTVDFRSDPMFREGLACSVAITTCEAITQSTGKLQQVEAQYKQTMGDARTVGGIETYPTEPSLDDFLACRL